MPLASKSARPNASYLTKLKITRGDFFLFLLILILTFIQFLFLPEPVFLTNKAVVYQGRKILKIVDLSYPHKEKIGYRNKTLMILEVNSKGLKVASSSCPDKLCERQGYLSSKGDSIMCLPNRIVIRTFGEEKIDAVIR